MALRAQRPSSSSISSTSLLLHPKFGIVFHQPKIWRKVNNFINFDLVVLPFDATAFSKPTTRLVAWRCEHSDHHQAVFAPQVYYCTLSLVQYFTKQKSGARLITSSISIWLRYRLMLLHSASPQHVWVYDAASTVAISSSYSTCATPAHQYLCTCDQSTSRYKELHYGSMPLTCTAIHRH
jgi:hypothetical protein